MSSREEQVQALQKEWDTNPRWKGVTRNYTAKCEYAMPNERPGPLHPRALRPVYRAAPTPQVLSPRAAGASAHNSRNTSRLYSR